MNKPKLMSLNKVASLLCVDKESLMSAVVECGIEPVVINNAPSITSAEIFTLRLKLGKGLDKTTCLSLHNTKGGVGKTTVSVNLAYYLASLGYYTLLVDTCQSGGSSKLFGLKPEDMESIPYTLLDVFSGSKEISDIVLHPFGADMPLGLVPASGAMSKVELLLSGLTGREKRLKKALALFEESLGMPVVIIIDSPPNWGVLNINVLLASDHCLVPVETEDPAVSSLPLMITQYRQAIYDCDVDVAPGMTLIPNKMNRSHGSHKRMLEELRNNYGEIMMRDAQGQDIVFRQDAVITTAAESKMPIFLYNGRFKSGREDIKAISEFVIREVING